MKQCGEREVKRCEINSTFVFPMISFPFEVKDEERKSEGKEERG